MKCTQCNSEKLIKNVRALDRTQQIGNSDLSLEIYQDPEAMFFKQPLAIKLQPLICADCGFVMFSIAKFNLEVIKKNIEKNEQT